MWLRHAWLLCLLSIVVSVAVTESVVFDNGILHMEWEPTMYSLVQLAITDHQGEVHNFMRNSSKLLPLWSVQVVDSILAFEDVVDTRKCATLDYNVLVNENDQTTILLVFEQCQGENFKVSFNANVTVTIDHASSMSKWHIGFSDIPPTWSFLQVTLLQVGALEGAVLYLPDAFGAALPLSNTTSSIPPKCNIYPSSSCSFQAAFLTSEVNPPSHRSHLLYYGANDLSMQMKTLCSEVVGASDSDGDNANDVHVPPLVTLAWQITPPNTLQLPFRWSMPYALELGILPDAEAWDGAMYYQKSVGAQAPWTQAGPLIDNPQRTPLWLRNTSLWFNTGWQQLDIFNTTQGDPLEVAAEMHELLPHFDLAHIGLHWYVWDTIAFDTHYPDYFPAKPHFESVAAALANQSVHVFPYINGRLFSIHAVEWNSSKQPKECAVKVLRRTVADYSEADVMLHTESYGSGDTFVVPCPHTPYWQQLLSSIIAKCQALNVPGLYIDQIAAAGPIPCFDHHHSHPVGGGSWWAEGYRTILQPFNRRHGASNARDGSEGSDAFPLLTESNAEVYVGSVQGMLTLAAYHLPAPYQSAPLFPAIYSPYVITLGREFFVADTQPTPVVLWQKLAVMWQWGTALGWFSLAGTSTPPPMGLLPWLLAPQQAETRQYLRQLALIRSQALEFMVGGQLLRPLPQATLSNDNNDDAFHLYGSAWKSLKRDMVAVVVVIVPESANVGDAGDAGDAGDRGGTVTWSAVIDPRRYALPRAETYLWQAIQANGAVGAKEILPLQKEQNTIQWKVALDSLAPRYFQLSPIEKQE
jgi:hypothetical protein